MSQPIFTHLASEEERQVCEVMASRKLTVDQCESTLLLTGISKNSPYYSPPKSGKKGFFRSLYQAFQLSGRAESSSLAVTAPIISDAASSLSRMDIDDEAHPLSETYVTSESVPSEPQSCDDDEAAPPASETFTPRSILASLVSYQMTLVLRVAKAFAWSSSTTPSSEADSADEDKQESDDAATLVDKSSICPAPSRKVTLDLSSDYVTAARREELFGSTISQEQDETEPVELLTPLQRAIQQAREHGYHLHPRTPLGPVTPTSPTSPVKTSPPGLQKYNLRSHQVAASDFFRKEASHRAAVAVRNDNRQLLIGKKDWSPYEPPTLIMPEEEVPRLRVVLAPRRFAVRLWKTTCRGPSDWIEIEEKGPRGGVAVFKRNSHLRHELDLSPPALHLEQAAPAPAYSESPTDEDVSFDMPMFVDQLMEKLAVDKNHPSTRSEESSTRMQAANILSATEQNLRSAETPPSSRSNLGLKLRHLVSSATKRRASNTDSMDISSTDNSIAPRPHTPSPKLSPVQRLKLAAARRMHSAASVAQETNTCSDEPTPACLNSEAAELHRRALLNKYFHPRPIHERPPTPDLVHDGFTTEDSSDDETLYSDESSETTTKNVTSFRSKLDKLKTGSLSTAMGAVELVTA